MLLNNFRNNWLDRRKYYWFLTPGYVQTPECLPADQTYKKSQPFMNMNGSILLINQI